MARKVGKNRKRVKAVTKANKVTKSEVTRLGAALRSLGGLAGGTVGSYLGAPSAGAVAGSNLGAALSRWLGSGDYSVSKNTFVQKAASAIPMMHNTEQSVVIRHKEYLGPVKGSVDFKVQSSYPLNPGMSNTFPWLSKIARSFQEYEFTGVVFHYVPTSGTAISGSNPALGSVMLQTTYRTTDNDPQDKIEILNEFWSNEVVPTETMAHPVECDPRDNPFSVHYVRNTDITIGEPLMYDLGKTFLATQGMPADGNVVGDLWVTYEVRLRKPVIRSSVISGSGYSYETRSGASGTNVFGNTSIYWNGTFKPSYDGNKITIPVGHRGSQVILIVRLFFTGTTTPSWVGPSTLTNATIDNYNLSGGPDGWYTSLPNATYADGTLVYGIGIYPKDGHLPTSVELPTPTLAGATVTNAEIHLTLI